MSSLVDVSGIQSTASTLHPVLTGSFLLHLLICDRTVMSSSSNNMFISFSWGFVNLLSPTSGCFEVSYIHIDDPFCLLRVVILSLMSLILTMLMFIMLLWTLIIVLYLKICSLKIKLLFFWLPLGWNLFSHPYNVYMSLYL